MWHTMWDLRGEKELAWQHYVQRPQCGKILASILVFSVSIPQMLMSIYGI